MFLAFYEAFFRGVSAQSHGTLGKQPLLASGTSRVARDASERAEESGTDSARSAATARGTINDL